MSVHIHNEWADSMATWAAENAAELKCFTGRYPGETFGDDTPPVIVDRMREAYDPEDQTDSADGEVMAWLLKGCFVVGFVMACAWVIAGGLNV